ncbi:germinal-center associated nuclear protein [Gastrophryne carolinensis]
MNPNNPFGGPQASGATGLFGPTSVFGQSSSFGQSSGFGQLTTSQAAPAFGQSAPNQTPVFGQNAATQNVPSFGQASSGFPASAFGQASASAAPTFGQSGSAFGLATSGQSGSVFGQASSTQSGSKFGQSSSGQSGSLFGQTSAAQSASVFGQAPSAQSASVFGQAPSAQSASVFGQASPAQSGSVFGQPSATQSASLFGQASPAQSGSVFGQASSGQTSSVFGQASSGQIGLVFGQASSGQSAPMFGQANSGQAGPTFGQTNSGQSAPTFGQASFGQSAPTFGQATGGQSAPAFGQATGGQSAPAFGQATSGQSAPAFGQSTGGQSAPAFGQSTGGQSAPAFGQATGGQSAPAFGQATGGQSAPAFGQATGGQSAPAFGQATGGQSAPAFGQATGGQSAPAFGQATGGQSAPAFGQSAPAFGQATGVQSAPAFGQATGGQSAPAFGQATGGQSAPAFGQATGGQSAPAFGQATGGQSAPAFGQATGGQSAPAFGQPTSAFGLVTSAQSSSSPFGQSTTSSSGPAFGQTNPSRPSPFGQTPSGQSASPFAQTTSGLNSNFPQTGNKQSASSFGQSSTSQPSTTFGGNTSLFGQTESSSNPLFGQSVTAQTATSQSGKDGATLATGQGHLFSQSSAFIQPTSAQVSSVQAPTFGTTSSPPAGKTNVFGESSEKKSVFGLPASTSSSQQPKSVDVTFVNTIPKSDAPDSSLSTNLGPSSFGQMSSIPSANIVFKPIRTESDKSQESMERPLFGNPVASLDRQGSSLFSFSASKKLEDQAETPRPFTTAVSSFPDVGGGDEPVKGLKRKDDAGQSPRKHELASSDDISSDIQGEHPPVKRSSRLTRDLKGGANLLVRSLYDVVKSHVKSQQTESKKETIASSQVPEYEASSASQAAARSHPASETNKPVLAKSQLPAGPSQPTSIKPYLSSSQGVSSRTVSVVGPSYPAPSRDHSTAGPSSVKIRPLMELELPPKVQESTSKTPLRRTRRSDSTDSLPPLSPHDLTSFQLKNVPPNLNKKRNLEAFFKKYGKVIKVYCRPGSMTSFIHFSDHKCATIAKKKVKDLHKDISAFWYKKKSSPNKLPVSKTENVLEERKEKPTELDIGLTTSPISKPLLRTIKGSPKKNPLSKALQFDVENTDAPTTSSNIPVPHLPPSLLSLVGTVAETAEEKYRLLDQRDKILRQTRVKRTELDQAKVFVGTCPDMCPEKERYMRETRNQLSIFEILPGSDQIDHAAAVKEYSRSSADQEEPLPHELRPLSVLCLTMDYLVNHVMDHGENNYCDWFDFVWNRTRGIRKDITQQHLCDPVTVSLIEKCMRFHIHCAYELCEEPMSSFDPKINNENLTKCLQSVKEMYQDLQNRGETCPHEAEFRSYSVLLSLNKGDILREVQQFQESVRNSVEVKFAVQVFAAFNSTNYVRFFKLVQSASYLSSCILHGYFTQIRRSALQTLNVAYTLSHQRSSLFPLEEMARLLFFQDVDQAAAYLTSYGLNVSDGFVELNRLALTEPEAPLQPKKSLFISQKRVVSVGEIVNGAPLPEFSLHMPACSFDAHNRYIGVLSTTEVASKSGQEPPVSVDEQEVKETVPEERSIKRTVVVLQEPQTSAPVQSVFQPIVPAEAQLPPPPPPSPPKPAYTNEDVAAVLDIVVEEVVTELSVGLGQKGTAYVSAALGESSAIADSLLSDVIMDMSGIVTNEVVEAETLRVQEEKRRKAEEARRIKEREQLLSSISQSECESLFKKVLQENIYKIAGEELKKAIKADHDERVSKCSEHVNDQYMGQFLEEELCHLVKETLQEMRLFRKFFQRWREELASRKKLRRQMRGFPAAPGLMGHGGTLKALMPSAVNNLGKQPKGMVDLGRAGKMLISIFSPHQRTEQLLHKMKVQHYFQGLLCSAAWTALELPSLIARSLPSWKNCIFWKVVLALPETSEPGDLNSSLSKWLKAKFCWAGVQPSDDQKPVQTLALYNTLESHEGWPISVNVCVKVVHGPLVDSELDRAEDENEFWGTSSLVLLLPFKSEPSDWYWISAILQLKQLLNAKPFKPAPNLVVILPGTCPDAEQKVSEELGLPNLVSCDLISDYIVVSIPETVVDLKGTELVASAVQSLLSSCPHTPCLHALPFRQYIEDGVYHAFSDPFYYDMAKRRKYGLPSQDPAAIIDLYNSAIALLAEAVSSTRLGELSWPIKEFSSSKGSFVMPPMKWNNLEHLAWLKKAVLSFQIPQMDKPPEGAPWRPVCSMISGYVSQIPVSSKALPVLESEVQMLLEGVSKHCLDQKEDEATCLDTFVHNVPWDDLIALCINHKLRDWAPPLNAPIKGMMRHDMVLQTVADRCSKYIVEDLYVYFFESDLENFRLPETWLKASLSTDKDILAAAERPQLKRKSVLQPSKSTLSLSVTREENSWKESLHFHPNHFENHEENESSQSKTSMLSLQQSQEPSFVTFKEKTQCRIDDLKSLQTLLDRALLAEKEESERFNRRLQELLEEEPLDISLSLPLYLPNTSLHGALESAVVVSAAERSLSDTRMHILSKPEPQKKNMGSTSPSLKELLDSLQMNIKRYRDEDAALNLHYSTLLDVADPVPFTKQD